jgi:hypothetical protein
MPEHTVVIGAIVCLIVLYLVNQSKNLRKDVSNLEMFMIDRHQPQTQAVSQQQQQPESMYPQQPTQAPQSHAPPRVSDHQGEPQGASTELPLFPGFNNGAEGADDVDYDESGGSDRHPPSMTQSNPLFGDDIDY